MTKWQITRADGPWEYPTYGFTATSGAILDGTLFDTEVTVAPDAFWDLYEGASAETGITRWGPVTFVNSQSEPADGAALVYNATSNVYEPSSAALSGTYAAVQYFERRAGAGAYTTGDVMLFGEHAYAPTGIATAAVFGGATNYENVIGGNLANVNTATSNLTGAAALTDEDGNWNFIHGGYDNVVNGWACSVMGFHCKVEADADHVTIAGGSLHTAQATASWSTIGGGTTNTVADQLSTVAGGSSNSATGAKSFIGGGTGNTATADSAVVVGGASNDATNANATIVGGNSHTASGNSSTIGGGLTNTASATGATVPGGRDNTASGLYSIATGRGAIANEAHMHAHGSTPFAAVGDAQINRWVLKKQTTDATAGNLEADTGAPPVIPENTTWAFSALVVARRTDVDGDNAAFRVEGCFKRDAGSTAAMVGTPTVTALGASAGAATWTVTTGSFSVGTLRLIVTGEAAKTIRWVAELRASSASG